MKVLNEKTTEKEVMIINEEGNNEGVVSLDEALDRAYNMGWDLVKLDGNSEIPVCKIMDYNKFMYEQSRKNKKAKSNKVKWKEVKLNLNIGEHDLLVKANSINKFLSKGNKVKIILVLKGREISNSVNGIKLIDKLKTLITRDFKISKESKLEGNKIITHLE